MDVANLKGHLESMLGITFDNEYVFDLFNECLMDLAEVLRIETTAYADLTEEHQTVALPTHHSSGDVHELIMVTAKENGELSRLSLNNDDDKGYKLFGKELTFQMLKLPDKVTIRYYRYPQPISKLDDEPDIPFRFRHALKYYFTAVHLNDEVEAKMRDENWSKYYRVKNEINMQTKKQKGTHRARYAKSRPWT